MRFILIYCIILVGCYSLPQSKVDSTNQICLDKIKNALIGNWKISDNSIYYKTSYKFLMELDTTYDKCISTCYQNEIVELFGTPTETHKLKGGSQYQSSYNYLVSPPCKVRDPGDSQCDYFVFYFDENLKVVDSMIETKASIRSH